MLYILFIFGGIICGAIIGIIDGWGFIEKVLATFLYAIIGFIIGLVLAIGSSIISDLTFEKESIYIGSKEIHALRDNVGITGQFFLGSGGVDSKLKYHYITKEDKGMRTRSVDVGNAYINEIDGVEPSVSYYKKQFKNKTIQWLTPAFYISELIFEVPPNSVIQDYNIDLE